MDHRRRLGPPPHRPLRLAIRPLPRNLDRPLAPRALPITNCSLAQEAPAGRLPARRTNRKPTLIPSIRTTHHASRTTHHAPRLRPPPRLGALPPPRQPPRHRHVRPALPHRRPHLRRSAP